MLQERNHNHNQQHQNKTQILDVTNIAYQNFINSLKSSRYKGGLYTYPKKLSN